MAVVSREFLAEDAALGARELIEYCYAQGWTDGLPVVPPIREFVDEFLATTDRDPDEVLMVQAHLDRACTVRQAAINAVMAGCRAEYFPVVLAAVDAFEASGIARTNLMQSTTGQAEILIVNGPLRQQLGFNSTENIFGPGDRANATVGRALRLIIMNVLGIRPHEFDQSTQGTSAKYACCFAENEEDSPWEPLHVERGFPRDASTVTLQMMRSDLYVANISTICGAWVSCTRTSTTQLKTHSSTAPPGPNGSCWLWPALVTPGSQPSARRLRSAARSAATRLR